MPGYLVFLRRSSGVEGSAHSGAPATRGRPRFLVPQSAGYSPPAARPQTSARLGSGDTLGRSGSPPPKCALRPQRVVSRFHAASGITASDAEGEASSGTLSRQADQRFARRRQPRLLQHERLQRWQRGAISPAPRRTAGKAWTSLCGPGSDWSQRSDASDWPGLPSQGVGALPPFPAVSPRRR